MNLSNLESLRIATGGIALVLFCIYVYRRILALAIVGGIFLIIATILNTVINNRKRNDRRY